MRKGDKVKIKSWDEIKRTLTDGDDEFCDDEYCDNLFFAKWPMKMYCDKTYIIDFENGNTGRSGIRYKRFELIGNTWLWSEAWLKQVSPFLSDKDFDI